MGCRASATLPQTLVCDTGTHSISVQAWITKLSSPGSAVCQEASAALPFFHPPSTAGSFQMRGM